MSYKRLFILIEGNDDERFIEEIIKPVFENYYDYVKPWKYAQIEQKLIKSFLKSIKAMKADYIYVQDIEGPCVTARKEKIKDKYGELIENGRIGIVIKEIESWYLGGLNDNDARKLTGRRFRTTDDIIKEQFNKFVTYKFESRLDFMIEILKFFSIDVAKRKNKSFKYFCDRFLSELSEC